jgi:hypothetical protein
VAILILKGANTRTEDMERMHRRIAADHLGEGDALTSQRSFALNSRDGRNDFPGCFIIGFLIS